MARPPKQEFGEPFFGYKLDAQGFHTGKSLPKTNSDQLLEWIENWVETTHELRVTDTLDRMVMQIVQGRMIFPVRDDGVVLVWNKETKGWKAEEPPVNDELQKLRASVAASRNSAGRFMYCIKCQKPFTDENVKTPAGWRETQISGYCETCFDGLFDEEEDDASPA